VTGTFEDALTAVSGVEGWMTDAQARRLWEAAARLRPGAQVVEIGSYRGRSAVILARAAREGVSVVAIDPHAGNDRGPMEFIGTSEEGEQDHHQFHETLRRAGVDDRVRHVRLPSSEALDQISGPIDLLYVDGAHRYRPARDDIVNWGDRVAPGGLMLIHDAFSAIGLTLAQLRLLVPGAEFRYEGRETSLAVYRRQPLSARERVGNAARQLAQLPMFFQYELIKLALILRLRPVARALGLRTGPWPY
jgi:predicted O-methyltransferase YrrM